MMLNYINNFSKLIKIFVLNSCNIIFISIKKIVTFASYGKITAKDLKKLK